MIQIDNCIKYFNKLILNDLVDPYSILDKKPLIKCWIAGGALKSYFLGESFMDVDLFFPNRNEFDKAENIFRDILGAEKIFENNNVIKFKYKGKIFDLVKKHFKDPQETINNFDFTVTCCAVDREKIYNHPSFFIDLSKKQLMVNNLPYPISTMWRMQKYMLKGYRMCKEEMSKVVKAIQSIKIEELYEGSDSSSSLVDLDLEGSDSTMFNGID